MQTWILLALGITAIVVLLGIGMVVFVLLRNARAAQDPAVQGKYPPGHWMAIGMAIGLPIGYLPVQIMGILADNFTLSIAIGPALACALGVAIGAALEQKYKDKIRPLTQEEQKMRKWATLIGLFLLVLLGVLALGGAILFVSR